MTRRSKLHTSRKWLYARYVKDRLSEQEIAKLAGVDQATINRWLHKFELRK